MGEFSIFENQDEVAENLNKSAEAVGSKQDGGVEKLAKGELQEKLVANRSCKVCWGRGTLVFYDNKNINTRKNSASESTTKLCKCVSVQMV